MKNNSSVIRQKGESQNSCYKKTKHIKFSEKRTFLTTWYAHVRVRIRELKMFVFLKIWRALFSWDSFWDSPFCLITNELFEFVAKSSCFLISFNKTTTKNFEIQPNECFSFSFCNVEQVILNGFTNWLVLIPFSQYLNSHIAWFKLIKHLFLKKDPCLLIWSVSCYRCCNVPCYVQQDIILFLCLFNSFLKQTSLVLYEF